MDRVKVHRKGKRQTIRLPGKYRFDSKKVYIRKLGNMVVLVPEDDPWRPLRESLELFTDDFMAEREQPDA